MQKHPFKGTTAFLMGNEGQGLTPQQIEACEQFVYIPQHSDATASVECECGLCGCFASLRHVGGAPRGATRSYKYLQGPSKQAIAHSGVGLKQMRTLNADGSVLEVTQLRDGAGAEEAAADGVADGEDAAAEEEEACLMLRMLRRRRG